jgi:hypothetical protein
MGREHRRRMVAIRANTSRICTNLNQKQKLQSAALGAKWTCEVMGIIADRLHAEGWLYGIAKHFTKHGFLFCVDAYPRWKTTHR